jgi:tyrosinase
MRKGSQLLNGFSVALEQNPHGVLHIYTSGSDELGRPNGDMGSTSTAGRDPIFWVHHATIDWFWARWLDRNNHDNNWIKEQPWAKQSWSFVDEQGQLIRWTFAEFVTQITDNPGYDSLKDPGALVATEAQSLAPVAAEDQFLKAPVATGGPIQISAPSNQPKKPISTKAVAATQGFALPGHASSVQLETHPGFLSPMEGHEDAPLSLRLNGVTTDRPLGVVFDLYLNLDDPTHLDESHRVGKLSFFAMGEDHMAGAERTFVFPLTGTLREIALHHLSNPQVTFVPSSSYAGSAIKVRSIELLVLLP